MSEITEKAISYGAATGVLSAIVEALLIWGLPKEDAAKTFIKHVELNKETMPNSVISLKDRVKEKYNL